ncbi:hypothetical protein B0H63DRAFT_563206 [Podospora didyma]|uniref:Filamentation protein n=1 Tax=Podospora didyma TaxID=330526 RepID=A0AAE0KEY6_9PEZI|nr:hypothetical protein B0H63DRAFT_563206 [Podospora didyma]
MPDTTKQTTPSQSTVHRRLPNPDAVKAAHYLQQLDDARCEEKWDAVPELVRKVRKHAPHRSCLALTAETEGVITKASKKTAPVADRPSTAGASAGQEVSNQLPDLLGQIEHEDAFPEDGFQAKVCVGWAHWVLGEYSLALSRLPKNFDKEYPLYEAIESLSEWTKVCALKASYLKANCLARNGQREKALEAFESALPSLSGVWATKPARQQLRYWAELFLTEYCMLASQTIREKEKSLADPNCLASFRTWSRYWAGSRGSPLPGGHGFRGSVPRRQVWSEYYFVLSEILQQDLAYPTGHSPLSNDSSARNQLRSELKKVETIFQGLLFSETRFPRADEERAEVEDFVGRAMGNWAILNGRGWKEHDLGAGGRESLSHGMLDTLYGAATKTYHSTAILRSLFTVHLAVAEFGLAFMAFDSWFEIIKKGKARIESSGHPEPGLDDDATMLETMSACIAALCRYGGKDAAEKARNLAAELELLIEKLALASAASTVNGVPPNIFALSWQSVGLANAQWARMTYDSESRTQVQEKAIQCLRKSLSPEFGQVVDVKGVFALGLLFAEQRKLPVAVELVKTALLAEKAVEENEGIRNGPYWRERSLVPLWHLLALMLSARQEYLMAQRACEGAMEQFKDPSVLFGSRGLNGPYRSDHLNEAGARDERAADGLVDEMDDYEKESILEIKMTQLSLLELVDGPAVAVNASTELLTLFPRLFGDMDQKLELDPKTEPPKTSATLRSLRGSMFGSRPDKPARPRQSLLNEKLDTIPSRPQTMQTAQSVATTAPTIQVSNEQQGWDARSSRRSQRAESLHKRSESGKRNSLRKRNNSGNRQRARSSSGAPRPTDGDRHFAPFDDLNLPQYFTLAGKAGSGHDSLAPATLKHSASNASSRRGTSELSGISVGGVESFSPLLPFVQFPLDHSRRRRKALLLKVWLVIAGFYRRANLIDHARKACAEAHRIVQALEAEVSNDTSGSFSARQAGWGQEKSVEELAADVCTMKGHLSLARERPYQARADFEMALTYFPNHPAAIVGLSNILMDVYLEKLLPPPAVPGIDVEGASTLSALDVAANTRGTATFVDQSKLENFPVLPSEPLGLVKTRPMRRVDDSKMTNGKSPPSSPLLLGPELPPPHQATSLPLLDRLAARDRAYGLLSGLTKLGSGWNNSEAWFALARAYEESNQVDKAKDALWWCVELEDGMGVRDWSCVGAGGVDCYIAT